MNREDIVVGMLVVPTRDGEGIMPHLDDIGVVVKAVVWPGSNTAVDEQGNVAYVAAHMGRHAVDCCHCSRLTQVTGHAFGTRVDAAGELTRKEEHES